jgi:hypothetical protein
MPGRPDAAGPLQSSPEGKLSQAYRPRRRRQRNYLPQEKMARALSAPEPTLTSRNARERLEAEGKACGGAGRCAVRWRGVGPFPVPQAGSHAGRS